MQKTKRLTFIIVAGKQVISSFNHLFMLLILRYVNPKYLFLSSFELFLSFYPSFDRHSLENWVLLLLPLVCLLLLLVVVNFLLTYALTFLDFIVHVACLLLGFKIQSVRFLHFFELWCYQFKNCFRITFWGFDHLFQQLLISFASFIDETLQVSNCVVVVSLEIRKFLEVKDRVVNVVNMI